MRRSYYIRGGKKAGIGKSIIINLIKHRAITARCFFIPKPAVLVFVGVKHKDKDKLLEMAAKNDI